MTALNEYLNEFFQDCDNISEFKVNFLKNHFYDKINKIIFIDYQDFLIGTDKKLPIKIRKQFLFFKSCKNDLFEIIYNIEYDKYAIRYKNNRQIYNISTLNNNNNIINHNNNNITNLDNHNHNHNDNHNHNNLDHNHNDNNLDNNLDNNHNDNDNHNDNFCKKPYKTPCCKFCLIV